MEKRDLIKSIFPHNKDGFYCWGTSLPEEILSGNKIIAPLVFPKYLYSISGWGDINLIRRIITFYKDIQIPFCYYIKWEDVVSIKDSQGYSPIKLNSDSYMFTVNKYETITPIGPVWRKNK